MNIIPLSLILIPRWFLYQVSDGRKIPINPYTLRPGNSRDSGSSYEFATERLATAEGQRYGGLIFRFDHDETAPFGFVDIDHCRNPQTGVIEPWALDIIKELGSYTEVSPSGTGVHILCRTERPPSGGCRKGRIEIYTRARCATVTGQHLTGTPLDLEDRTSELLELHQEVFGAVEPPAVPVPELPVLASTTTSPLTDAELLHLARTAANGRRFRELFDGPVPPGDHSRLDFELVCKLLFWGGHDFERVDRLFRQSALMRSKWWRADYRLRTMRNAAARCTEQYCPALTKESAHAA
jgi:primase-polymerase (primpol)-like protein